MHKWISKLYSNPTTLAVAYDGREGLWGLEPPPLLPQSFRALCHEVTSDMNNFKP